MKLTVRETAIVLASLRIAQEEGLDRLNAMPQMTDWDKAIVVEDLKEVDDLCEKINLED